MNLPSTDSKPLRERLLPQTSIRFFMVMISAAAIVMYIFRAAILHDVFWAKIVALLIQTIATCFLAYAVLFVLANMFTATTDPLLEAMQGSDQDHGQAPTQDEHPQLESGPESGGS